MLNDLFFDHMVTIFLVVLFAIRLLTKKKFRNAEARYFWLTLISCFLLVVEDSLEVVAALDPALRFWRTLLSILGYTLRSTAALGLLLVILPRNKQHTVWAIPSVITFLTCCTAFFTDVSFGFDQDYAFYRGPLGVIPFIVPLFYIMMILFFTFKRYSEKSNMDIYLVPLCVLFCLVATYKGVVSGGTALNEAIMISSITFYSLLYSHDNRFDPLTNLLSRQAFYDDCSALSKNIKAVASLDMNGLKALNDARGHKAGDEALQKIAERLQNATNHKASAYRIGGDEFAILFFQQDEEEIERIENQIKEGVEADGYSISAGHILLGEDMDLDRAMIESDRQLYKDKVAYYQRSGVDRRNETWT